MILFRSSVSFAQTIYADKYSRALKLVVADLELTEKYSNDDTLTIALFPQFHYFSLARFKKELNEVIGENEYNKLVKYDAKQAKQRNKLTFMFMTDDFYRKMPSQLPADIIIAFNRMNRGFITAEICEYEYGLDWKRLTSQQITYFLLFDMREGQNVMYKLKVQR